MIRFKTNEKNEITDVEYNDVRAFNILCPICYKEWRCGRGSVSIWYWLHGRVCGKTPEDIIKVPCGCYMSIWDIMCTSILIDELISKPVSRINRSGYLTKYSCSGHMHDRFSYLSFMYNYDELVHYITDNPYLTNILSLEVEVNGRKKDTMETYEWDPKLKIFIKTDVVAYSTTTPLESMTIRMKKQSRMSNLNSMLLFRKCLNRIAKWCEDTKAYKDKYDFGKNFERKHFSKQRNKF